MSKIATGVAAIGLSLCMVAVAVAARGVGGGGGHPGGGGGHPGGGGGAHFGGGGGAHFGGGGGAHFGGGGGAHFGGGGAHFTAHAAPHFSGRVGGGVSHVSHAGPTFRASHASHSASSFHAAVHGSTAHTSAFSHVTPGATAHSLATGGHFARTGLAGGPRAFAARRNFAANAAFHPFWHPGWHPGWHPYNHVGWLGPLFWPYAYGNLFYYSLWPYDYGYYDPFWVYGYGDIYEGIFSPYLYDEYVQGPGAPQRMTTLTQTMTQSCDDEAAEVTGWPIDQIQAAVQPNPDQSALLDALGNAVVKASDVIKSHCPTTVSFTPTGRIDDMQQRLQGMVQAVDTVSPPLGKFYDSLSDEQKARFNDIGANAPGAKPEASNGQPQNAPNNAPNPQAQCDASVMAWPTDRINQTIQPNDAQRTKLDALQSAMANAADTIKAACPTEVPTTPPARLAAAGKHLQAMLQAVDAIRPALHDFYDSLSDSQKARFNTMGKELFAQNSQNQE